MEKWDSGKDIDERRKCMEQKSSQSDNQEIGGVLPTNNYPTISFDTLDSLLMEYLEENKKENQSQVAENSMFPPSSSPTAINGEQKIDGKINTCFPEVLNPEEDKTKNSESPGQNLAENPCRSGTLQPTLPKPSSLLLSRDPLQFSMTFVNEVPEDQTREIESESELERRKKEPKNKKRPRNRESQDVDMKISKKIALSNTQDKGILEKECDKVTGGMSKKKYKRLPHPSGPDLVELGLGLAGLNMESTFHSQESARDQEIQNLGQENYKNIDCAGKKIRDKDAQKTCPSKIGGRIQNEEQKSSPLKDKEKGRALQSTSHTANTFDVLDTLLDKLSEENNEPSHNQESGLVISDSHVQSAPEKCMRKKAYSNNTSRKSKFKKENLSQPKNQEHSEFQITNDLQDPTTNQHYLLTTFPGANKQHQNEIKRNSRSLLSCLDTHHPLIPMKNKQKIGGKDLANFQQNYGPEESKSKQHRVPVSSLTDYRSTEKLQPDVPTHINLPHPNSQLENLPFPETNPYNEQQKESKVKKRKKKNEVRKLHKRKKEESIQMTLQCLLQMVQTMEKIVDNLMRSLRKSKH